MWRVYRLALDRAASCTADLQINKLQERDVKKVWPIKAVTPVCLLAQAMWRVAGLTLACVLALTMPARILNLPSAQSKHIFISSILSFHVILIA